MTSARGAVRSLAADRMLRWAVLPGLVLLASLVTFAHPFRDGPLALFEALAPVVYGSLLLLVVVAAVARSPALAVLTVLVVGFGFVAYGPPSEHVAAAPAPTLTLMTWNLHGDDLGEMGFSAVLASAQPDVVVLEEARLRGRDLDLVADWPFRVVLPQAATPPGMVILSRLPIDAQGVVNQPAAVWDKPRAPWIRISLGGHELTLVGVHLTFPLASLPCPYCPDERDGQVQALASFATGLMAAGDHLVVMGDFNLTEREPAYRDLSTVMADAGDSAGATWRPVAVEGFPPILRLDHIFTSADVVASDARVLCSGTSSDHCPLVATIGLRSEGGSA
jgi:vancomycin resistance protein VanJ